MSECYQSRITPKDLHILQTMFNERKGSNDPLLPLLQHKLETAIVLPSHEIPPEVVTLYSRVRYRIDAQPAVTRIVIHDALHETPLGDYGQYIDEIMGATVPVSSLRGLALLGLTSGTTTTIRYFGTAMETIHVEAIVYQPEAARFTGNAENRAKVPHDATH